MQILIAIFAYCYYYSYISKPEVTLGDVLSAATRLNDHDQVRRGTGPYIAALLHTVPVVPHFLDVLLQR